MKNLRIFSNIVKSASVVLIAGAGFFHSAHAGVIFSATSASINAGGPGYGSINDTFNQNGLNTGYSANVTDFDAYLAGGPTHSLVFSGKEWFSNQGTTSASVTYNFGSARTFDAMALWNEDASGIGRLNLSTSSDGITFSAFASGLTPTDNTFNLDYFAQVFSFGSTTAQYVRFDMSDCPQNNFSGCSIGEVAFRASQPNSEVPEPVSLALVGLGLAGLAAVRRRKAKQTA